MADLAQKTNAFKWQPNAKLLVFSLLMLPLLLSLGAWQLERGEEKQQIVDHHARNQQLPPVITPEILVSGEDHQYRLAWIRGTIDNQRIIILDNKVKNGRPGYEILQPLTLSGLTEKLLINRGWVEASLNREILPSIPPIEDGVQLRGYLYRTLEGGYRLDDGIGQVQNWPSRVGWISTDRAKVLYGEFFLPYQLRLDQDSPGALKTGWTTVAVKPEKHVGYAVQWFAMAITLLIMTIIANSNLVSWLRRKH